MRIITLQDPSHRPSTHCPPRLKNTYIVPADTCKQWRLMWWRKKSQVRTGIKYDAWHDCCAGIESLLLDGSPTVCIRNSATWRLRRAHGVVGKVDAERKPGTPARDTAKAFSAASPATQSASTHCFAAVRAGGYRAGASDFSVRGISTVKCLARCCPEHAGGSGPA